MKTQFHWLDKFYRNFI